MKSVQEVRDNIDGEIAGWDHTHVFKNVLSSALGRIAEESNALRLEGLEEDVRRDLFEALANLQTVTEYFAARTERHFRPKEDEVVDSKDIEAVSTYVSSRSDVQQLNAVIEELRKVGLTRDATQVVRSIKQRVVACYRIIYGDRVDDKAFSHSLRNFETGEIVEHYHDYTNIEAICNVLKIAPEDALE